MKKILTSLVIGLICMTNLSTTKFTPDPMTRLSNLAGQVLARPKYQPANTSTEAHFPVGQPAPKELQAHMNQIQPEVPLGSQEVFFGSSSSNMDAAWSEPTNASSALISKKQELEARSAEYFQLLSDSINQRDPHTLIKAWQLSVASELLQTLVILNPLFPQLQVAESKALLFGFVRAFKTNYNPELGLWKSFDAYIQYLTLNIPKIIINE